MANWIRLVVFSLVCGIGCSKEQRSALEVDSSMEAPGQPGQGLYFRFWINDTLQTVDLYRVRKANGASRMRLLADLPDSLRLSLFATPAVTGAQSIFSGNVLEDEVKFMRTHCDFYRQAGGNLLRHYDVDTSKIQGNQLEIIQIDTLQRVVTARFRVCMFRIFDSGIPEPDQLLLRGEFRAQYRE